jgi:hypothetical protein
MIAEEQRPTVSTTDRPIEIRATPARQGVGGLGVRYVLAIGLALVVTAFAIIYFINF